MLNELRIFEQNIAHAKSISDIYNFLNTQVHAPMSFDDLLRSQIVYSVSAFDKLMHDVIRKGMMEIFQGIRVTTPKYLAEPITMSTFLEIEQATIPPREYYYEQAIMKKLKTLSFQDPAKVADGLSYIWAENQKWQKVATSLGITQEVAKVKLKLIIDRRNMIVHEADMDPITGVKIDITQTETETATDYLLACGRTIVSFL